MNPAHMGGDRGTPDTWRAQHLPADTPGTWLATHVCTHLTPDQRAAAVPTAALVASGWFEQQFAGLLDGGAGRALAATQLAAAFGGTVAMELGYAYAGAGAGFLPAPGATRWVLGDGFWPDGVVFDATADAIVLPTHAWAAEGAAHVAGDIATLRVRTVEAIVAIVEPVIEHVAGFSRAGRAGLWNEVVDALPDVLTWSGYFRLDQEVVADFLAMAAAPGVPWRRTPTLELVVEEWGTACVKHRGGCCLEYTVRGEPRVDGDDERARFHRAFPLDGRPWYCDTCRFFTHDESRARQLWWHRRAAADATT